MKILVAVDGSAHTKRMLAYLAAHDEWLGTHHDYSVLTVAPPLPARVAMAVPKDTLAGLHADGAEKVLKPIRAFFARQGLQAQFLAKTGEPSETIAALADKGRFDLLMMGSHGHGTLANVVLGSVVTKVMARCKLPVLVVR